MANGRPGDHPLSDYFPHGILPGPGDRDWQTEICREVAEQAEFTLHPLEQKLQGGATDDAKREAAEARPVVERAMGRAVRLAAQGTGGPSLLDDIKRLDALRDRLAARIDDPS